MNHSFSSGSKNVFNADSLPLWEEKIQFIEWWKAKNERTPLTQDSLPSEFEIKFETGELKLEAGELKFKQSKPKKEKPLEGSGGEGEAEDNETTPDIQEVPKELKRKKKMKSSTDDDDIMHGRGKDDMMRAGAGNDEVYGGKGKDTLHGGLGNDELHGQEGKDKLYGGKGDDVLIGGLAQDTLTGGAGADNFVYEAVRESFRGKADRITDFQTGVDHLLIAQSIALTVDELKITDMGRMTHITDKNSAFKVSIVGDVAITDIQFT